MSPKKVKKSLLTRFQKVRMFLGTMTLLGVVLFSLAFGFRAYNIWEAESTMEEMFEFDDNGFLKGSESIELTHVDENREGRKAILLLHGLSSSPQVYGELAEILFDEGYDVFAPRLPFHGKDLESFHDLKWQDLILFADEYADTLFDQYDSVSVLGQSNGAVLGVYLGTKYDFEHAVFLGGSFVFPAEKMAQLEKAEWVKWIYLYDKKKPRLADIWDDAALEERIAYPYMAINALLEFRDMLAYVTEKMSEFNAPVLLLQSRGEATLTEENMEFLKENLGSQIQEEYWVEGCGHVVTVDFCKEEVFEKVTEFLLSSPL